MKVSFATRLLLVIVIVVAACVYLGAVYVGAESQYQQGKDQVTQTRSALTKVSVEKKRTIADVQSDIKGVEAQYQALLNSFPASVEDAVFVKRLLTIAESNELKVVDVTTAEGASKPHVYTFPLSTVTIKVEGSYSHILLFVLQLEGTRSGDDLKELPPLTMNKVDIAAEGQTFGATISFSIVGQPAPLPTAAVTSTTPKPAVTGQ